MTYEHSFVTQPPQLVQTKFRFVLIPLNIIVTKAFLYICSFSIWRPQATRRVGVKVQFNFQEVQTQPSIIYKAPPGEHAGPRTSVSRRSPDLARPCQTLPVPISLSLKPKYSVSVQFIYKLSHHLATIGGSVHLSTLASQCYTGSSHRTKI
jgi:hypothetical protein